MLIDTHTHIYCEEFDEDRAEVIRRAVDAGVGLMLLPAIDEQTTSRQDDLAEAYPELFRQMVGLHPTSVDENYCKQLDLVAQRLFAFTDKYVAVGEIGLDFYWDTTFSSQQRDALCQQMAWAHECGKPVALHVRNAYEELFKCLDAMQYSSFNGVLHCYSGTLEQAQIALDMGFFLGIGGVVTFKKSSLPDIVSCVPLERIVLETDAPYLAPHPFRGRRNEPSYLTNVAAAVAAIRNETVETIANQTTLNARRLFSL